VLTNKYISQKISQLAPSPTLLLNAKAKEMQSQGIPVLNLTAGEPDFDTPEVIRNAGIEAIQSGFSHYTQPEGILALREAICEKFKADNNLHYTPTEVMAGAGSKGLLYVAFQTLCNKGDEVLLATPTWATYIEQIKLAGAKPVLIRLTPPFRLTAKDVEKAITKKTKVLLINSPANPTGVMIETKELKKIATLVIKHDIFVIADEIYEKLIYTSEHFAIASLNEKIKKQTLTINGVSKAYAMTGWRLGYAGGPEEIINSMKALQSQIVSNPPSYSQKAAKVALQSDPKIVEHMRKEFDKRRKMGLKELQKIPQLTVIPPDGAFYFFISVEKLLGKQYKTATEWCKALLKKEGVALVPGEDFMSPGYVRMSFAVSQDDILAAIKKIKKFITV